MCVNHKMAPTMAQIVHQTARGANMKSYTTHIQKSPLISEELGKKSSITPRKENKNRTNEI